jgi:membrane-bound inhibitor of C-type lysozyme
MDTQELSTRLGRTLIAGIALASLAACSSWETRAPAPVDYVCDHAKSFKVSYHPSGDSATIEINQMRFALQRERSGSGAKYSCDVLTLRTTGREAQLELEGAPAYSNCREVRQ